MHMQPLFECTGMHTCEHLKFLRLVEISPHPPLVRLFGKSDKTGCTAWWACIHARLYGRVAFLDNLQLELKTEKGCLR